MERGHNPGCSCPHCNGMDIPMQYAIRPLHDDVSSLFAIDESCGFEQFLNLRNKGLNPQQPVFPQVMPEDENVFVIAYGMLHPQDESILRKHWKDFDSWEKMLAEHKNHSHCTLVNGKLRMSAFADFVLFPELSRDPNKIIPCALLLTTALDFKKLDRYIAKEIGFGGFCVSPNTEFKKSDFAAYGYTTYLQFRNVGFFENIIDRPYLFCLQEQEESFDNTDINNWKNYIDVAKLMRLSRISY